ncbi:MAG: M23 family metallopeptidase [bacterium]|nr:M23 family metallopeptidase [bacterium]
MKRKGFEVILMPHNANRIRNITLTSFKLSGILFSLLLAFSSLFFTNLGRIWVENLELQRLRNEKVELKERVKEFVSKTEELEKQMIRLEELEDSLKRLAGLPKDFKLMGKGGPEVALPPISAKSLDKTLDNLRKKASLQISRFYEIKKEIEKKGRYLSLIPCIWPVDGEISSFFGPRISPFTKRMAFHKGLDIVAPIGTPIKATASGKISYTGWKEYYGLNIIINHGNRYKTVYGHLSKIKVKKGGKVKRGDVIGLLGNTGRSTGPHLHYEFRVNNRCVDPLKWMSH